MGKVGASKVEAATYVAAYAGMERNEQGRIVFRKREEEYKEDDGSTRRETVTRVNMFFKIVRGDLQGLAVPWSVKVVVDGQPKGFRVLKQASGQAITFDAPSQWSPWLIRVMAACGVDFEGGDLQRPLFETPLTLSSIMEGLNALMLEKAGEGVLVNIETREGSGGLRVATLPKRVSRDVEDLVNQKLAQEGQEGAVDAQASIASGLDKGVPLAGEEEIEVPRPPWAERSAQDDIEELFLSDDIPF